MTALRPSAAEERWLAAAEWLILRRRLFGCGIEEALEVASLLVVAAQVLNARSGWFDPATPLLLAVALAAAGIRLLNPLLVTAAPAERTEVAERSDNGNGLANAAAGRDLDELFREG
jgi:hypothetical protein